MVGSSWRPGRNQRRGGQRLSSLYNETGELIDGFGEESVQTVADWQAHSDVYGVGEIERFEEGDDYPYVRGNAVNAYHIWKVSHFDRSMVYLRDRDALVVYDRVSVSDAVRQTVSDCLELKPNLFPGLPESVDEKRPKAE